MVWVTAVDTMLPTLVLVNDTTMTCGIHRHVHTRAAVHPHLGVALHRQGYATLDYAAIPVVRLLSGEPDRAGGPGRLPSEPEPATAAGTRAASMG
jgi:hypothetical protein